MIERGTSNKMATILVKTLNKLQCRPLMYSMESMIGTPLLQSQSSVLIIWIYRYMLCNAVCRSMLDSGALCPIYTFITHLWYYTHELQPRPVLFLGNPHCERLAHNGLLWQSKQTDVEENRRSLYLAMTAEGSGWRPFSTSVAVPVIIEAPWSIEYSKLPPGFEQTLPPTLSWASKTVTFKPHLCKFDSMS